MPAAIPTGGSGLGSLLGGIAGGIITGGSGTGAGSVIGGAIGGLLGGTGGAGTTGIMYQGKYNYWKDVPAENMYGMFHGGWGKVWEDWHNSQDYNKLKPELMRKAASLGAHWVLANVGKGSGTGGTHTDQDWEYVAWKAITGQAPLNSIDGKDYTKILSTPVGSSGGVGVQDNGQTSTTDNGSSNSWLWIFGAVGIVAVILVMSAKPMRRYAVRRYAQYRNNHRRSSGYKRTYRPKRRW